MLANLAKTDIIDNRSKAADVAVTFDTSNHKPGNDNGLQYHLKGNVIRDMFGVVTPDMLGSKMAIKISDVSQTDNANTHYGLIFHTGEHGENLLDTPTKAIVADASANTTHAYHAIIMPNNALAKTTLKIRPTAAAVAHDKNDDKMPYKRLGRWLEHPAEPGGPFNLLGPEHVDNDVTVATLGDETKYIVGKNSAVHRLITNSHENDNPSSFCEGKYTPSNLKMANANGMPGIVMTKSDFEQASGVLKPSLDMTNTYPIGQHGLHLTLVKLGSGGAPNPKSITVPLTLERELPSHPVDPASELPITVEDVDRVVRTKAFGKLSAPSTFEADAFGPQAPDCKATLTRLVAETESK